METIPAADFRTVARTGPAEEDFNHHPIRWFHIWTLTAMEKFRRKKSKVWSPFWNLSTATVTDNSRQKNSILTVQADAAVASNLAALVPAEQVETNQTTDARGDRKSKNKSNGAESARRVHPLPLHDFDDLLCHRLSNWRDDRIAILLVGSRV